jgi:copper chaperone CopZ
MSIQSHPSEALGILRITGGIHSDEQALFIKAALEDLPGVHAVELSRDAATIRFDPDLTAEQQFYEAVKLVGSHASGFAAQAA